MNRRHLFGLFAGIAAMAGIRSGAAAGMPRMVPGRRYCLRCDADLLPPHHLGSGHVAPRLGDDRTGVDVYLHGEQVLRSYEVLDGQWAVVAWENRSLSHVLFEGCRLPGRDGNPVQVTLDLGPYDVRRTERQK